MNLLRDLWATVKMLADALLSESRIWNVLDDRLAERDRQERER